MPLVEHTAGGIRAGTSPGVCVSGSGDVDAHDEGRVTSKGDPAFVRPERDVTAAVESSQRAVEVCVEFVRDSSRPKASMPRPSARCSQSSAVLSGTKLAALDLSITSP